MLGPDFLKYVATQHVTRTPASVSIRLIAKAAFDSSALRHGARTTTSIPCVPPLLFIVYLLLILYHKETARKELIL